MCAQPFREAPSTSAWKKGATKSVSPSWKSHACAVEDRGW